MSTPTKDGGPAFPVLSRIDEDGNADSTSGMSLRDWFAGQATEADIDEFKYQQPSESNNFTHERTRAQAKYAYADAMIEARAGKAGRR